MKVGSLNVILKVASQNGIEPMFLASGSEYIQFPHCPSNHVIYKSDVASTVAF
jgi:hypothetical protein